MIYSALYELSQKGNAFLVSETMTYLQHDFFPLNLKHACFVSTAGLCFVCYAPSLVPGPGFGACGVLVPSGKE